MKAEKIDSQYANKLRQELIARQSRNASYSIRSFARDLEISPATLSQVLSSKRTLSKKSLLKVSDKLSFKPSEIALGIQRSRDVLDHEFRTLADDEFHMLSDWFYFAILSWAGTGKAKASSSAVAKHFGLSELQAADAIERLKRLGIIQVKGDRIVYDGRPLKTTSDIPSSAARKLQRDHLALAALSIERDAIQTRDMTSMTFSADVTRIPEAKEMIKKFRRRLTRFLEGDGAREPVYVFSLQLFPVSKASPK